MILVVGAVVIVVDLKLGLNLWDLRHVNENLSVVVVELVVDTLGYDLDLNCFCCWCCRSDRSSCRWELVFD